MEVLMVQDLTDVLCTAGKQNAVLLSLPFSFSPPISPSSFPSHSVLLPLPLSLVFSLVFSLTLFPFHLPVCPLQYLPRPFFLQFVLLPLPISSVLLPLFPFPPPSSLYPLPKFLSSIFPSQSVTFPLPLSAFIPLPLFPFSLFALPFIPAHFTLFHSPCQSVPSHCSTSPYPLPVPLFSPLPLTLICPHNTSPSHSVLKAVMF